MAKKNRACYSIDYVLDLVKEVIKSNDYYNKKVIALPTGNSVTVSATLRAYVQHGTQCCTCGLKAGYFLEKHKGSGNFTLVLMSKARRSGNGCQIMFGIDHKVPRHVEGSVGVGANICVMCQPCNSDKGSKLIYDTTTVYRIASVKDTLKELYSGDDRFTKFFASYCVDLESRSKTDPHYGFITYDGLLTYAAKVKELFGLEIDIDSVKPNFLPVTESPFASDFFTIPYGSDQWNLLYNIIQESKVENQILLRLK